MSEASNIYQQQAHNRHLTVALLAGFILFLAFLGWGFDTFMLGNDALGVFGGDSQAPFIPPIGTLAALALAAGSSLWSYYLGASAVLAASHARPITPGDPRTRQLENVVEEMAIAAGLPKPQIYILPDSDPNAFATGRDPRHAHIAVTQGLLTTLNREELQGVVAHEMSHIRNYDIRVMMVVAALVGAIALLSDWAARMRWFGGSRRSRDDDNSKGGNPLQIVVLVIWLLAIILAPLVSQLAAMAVSRRREYLADASGAELTRNPLGLAQALEKIEAAAAPTQVISRGTAHLCIADPLGRSMGLREGPVAELFSTHPPMAKRIAALKAMGYQYQQTQQSPA